MTTVTVYKCVNKACREHRKLVTAFLSPQDYRIATGNRPCCSRCYSTLMFVESRALKDDREVRAFDEEMKNKNS